MFGVKISTSMLQPPKLTTSPESITATLRLAYGGVQVLKGMPSTTFGASGRRGLRWLEILPHRLLPTRAMAGSGRRLSYAAGVSRHSRI